jgi:uncharacterized protein YndB with AHSA1/START domain
VALIEGEIVMARPVEEVFDFVADQRNEPRYNPDMTSSEMVTEGPIGVGTQFQAQITTGSGALKMLIEIIAYERPRLLGTRTTMSGTDTEGMLTFEALGEGTRMHWSWDVEPPWVFRFAGPLVGFLGRRQEKAIWTSLKRYLESQR